MRDKTPIEELFYELYGFYPSKAGQALEMLGTAAYYLLGALLDSFAAYKAMKNATMNAATGKSPFWLMTSEEVFQKTLDPDRDPNNFKHIVNDQFVKMKIEGRYVTLEQVASEIREMLKDTHERYYEIFTFRDLIPKE